MVRRLETNYTLGSHTSFWPRDVLSSEITCLALASYMPTGTVLLGEQGCIGVSSLSRVYSQSRHSLQNRNEETSVSESNHQPLVC